MLGLLPRAILTKISLCLELLLHFLVNLLLTSLAISNGFLTLSRYWVFHRVGCHECTFSFWDKFMPIPVLDVIVLQVESALLQQFVICFFALTNELSCFTCIWVIQVIQFIYCLVKFRLALLERAWSDYLSGNGLLKVVTRHQALI